MDVKEREQQGGPLVFKEAVQPHDGGLIRTDQPLAHQPPIGVRLLYFERSNWVRRYADAGRRQLRGLASVHARDAT